METELEEICRLLLIMEVWYDLQSEGWEIRVFNSQSTKVTYIEDALHLLTKRLPHSIIRVMAVAEMVTFSKTMEV
jgi:hypothetical protein